MSDPGRAPPPDVEIAATARADRVRFGRVPEIRVEHSARPDGDSGSDSERKNLPNEVKPGVTYRDVRIRWRAAARVSLPDDAEPRSSSTQRR